MTIRHTQRRRQQWRGALVRRPPRELGQGLASRIPLPQPVPEFDRRFTQAPAEVDLRAPRDRGEVYEPRVQVAQDHPALLQTLDQLAKLLLQGVQPLLRLADLVDGRRLALQRRPLPFHLIPQRDGLVPDAAEAAHRLLDVRERPGGFFQREELRHGAITPPARGWCGSRWPRPAAWATAAPSAPRPCRRAPGPSAGTPRARSASRGPPRAPRCTAPAAA